MSQDQYLSVGELAQQAHTTVRTIQYYDQLGIMKPSARGPQNQRLYRPEDLATLSHIRTLQYLGYSLTDIRDGAVPETPASLDDTIDERMSQLEEEFKSLFKRVATLRSLQEMTHDADESIDWSALEQVIERCQNDRGFERHRQAIREAIRSGNIFGAPMEGGPHGHPGSRDASPH